MSSVRPKIKPDLPVILTGWDLRTGVSVWFAGEAGWTSQVIDALVLDQEAARVVLDQASPTELVGAYMVEADDAGRPAGREWRREGIRAAACPTIAFGQS